jgi:hypothetical protein
VNAGEVKIIDMGKKWKGSVGYCLVCEGKTSAPRTVTEIIYIYIYIYIYTLFLYIHTTGWKPLEKNC